MKEKSSFDVDAAIVADFEGALERLDAGQLREFVRTTVSPSAASRGDHGPQTLRSGAAPRSPGSEELAARRGHHTAFALLEFAARRLSKLHCAEDPALLADVSAWARSAKRKGHIDEAECELFLTRLRRLWLAGAAETVRQSLEVLFDLVADLDGSLAALEVPAPNLTRSAIFGMYLASVYESMPASKRVAALLDAVGRICAVGSVHGPLRLLEEHALRPIDDLATFTQQWIRALEQPEQPLTIKKSRRRETGEAFAPREALLAEALERIEGLGGIARMARRAPDLARYRTWILRLTDESRWDEALRVVSEAREALADAFSRGVVLDAGVAIAAAMDDTPQLVGLAEAAFFTDATLARLARWLLIDEPERATLLQRVRSARELGVELSAAMKCLLAALSGSIAEVNALLDDSGEIWDEDAHPGRIAVPTVLIAFYGGPRGTSVATKLCAPLFGGRSRAPGPSGWQGWEPPDAILKLSVPSPGPAIVEACKGESAEHAAGTARIPATLRIAAARRTAVVLSNKERANYDAAALLIVAAAEATFTAGDEDLARAYLAEVAQAATRYSTFRGALTRTLARSALVNAL